MRTGRGLGDPRPLLHIFIMGWFLLAGDASVAASLAAGLGMVQACAGVLAVRRFAARLPVPPGPRPPVTVLKPLHGDEPLLEAALATFFTQDYPDYQLVFGVDDVHDPAVAVVARLRQRFPAADVALVVCEALHGSNRKVSNLINMIGVARHDWLVIADSDVHAAPDYLSSVVAELGRPDTGLVTALSVGLPATESLQERLAASQITYGFLPGVLMARALGRQDCLGITMALRRETLDRAGGLEALADHLADDNVLGGLVRAQGLTVRLATTLPATTVADKTLAAGFEHELRWARTIRTQAAAGYAASVLQYPIAWACLAAILSGGARGMVLVVALAWATRGLAGWQIDRMLRPLARGSGYVRALRSPFLLFPLREAMSVAVMVASYRTRRVVWRGHAMVARRGPRGAPLIVRVPQPVAAIQPGP
jgi:ceramide glucosyltransferase